MGCEKLMPVYLSLYQRKLNLKSTIINPDDARYNTFTGNIRNPCFTIVQVLESSKERSRAQSALYQEKSKYKYIQCSGHEYLLKPCY